MINQRLNVLYEAYGYRKVRMSKFEQYELYVENKDFLGTNQIITFTDLDGSLLALKPDVTLSILKSGFGAGRFYYNENVYRSKDRHFKEISQSGIEYIGELSVYAEVEVIALAARSLSLFSDDIVIRISDVVLLSEIFNHIGVAKEVKPEIISLLESKNCVGLKLLADGGKISEETFVALEKLVNIYMPFEEGIRELEKSGLLKADEKEKHHLERLAEGLRAFGILDKVYLDFSVINSMDYYNGIIFQGAVSDIPFTLLTGGRYDRLAAKMGKAEGAVGFAVDVSLIENYKKARDEYDLDCLIIFNEESESLTEAVSVVKKLAEEGKKVQLVSASEAERSNVRARRRLALSECVRIERGK